MLFEIQHSSIEVFSIVKHELNRGALDKKHPFRYVVFATQGDVTPDLRHVVLRKIDEDLSFFIYTDARTQKVKSIQADPNVSLLFYHPQKRAQIRISGQAYLHYQDALATDHWNRVQGEARKAYNSLIAPGLSIHQPEEAFFWNEDLTSNQHFMLVEVVPYSIEALQLNGLEHLRIRFTREEDSWTGSWIAP